jgi:hypothetical protein
VDTESVRAEHTKDRLRLSMNTAQSSLKAIA